MNQTLNLNRMGLQAMSQKEAQQNEGGSVALGTIVLGQLAGAISEAVKQLSAEDTSGNNNSNNNDNNNSESKK